MNNPGLTTAEKCPSLSLFKNQTIDLETQSNS